MTWSSPVTDRTQADVDLAIWQLNKWQQQILDGFDITYTDLKGVFNVSDINRIEQNTKFLQDNLKNYAVKIDLDIKTWTKADIPTKKDIARLIGNVSAILQLYYKLQGTVNLPTNIKIYTDVNAMEINLNNIKSILDAMVASFKKSGTTQCGAKYGLPKRR